MNAPFATEKQTVGEVPLWRQPALQDLARSFAWPVGTLLFAALVLLGVLRPALRAFTQPQMASAGAGGALNALVADDNPRPGLLGASGAAGGDAGFAGGGGQGSQGALGASGLPGAAGSQGALAMSEAQGRLEDARRLTRENPVAVANIVKAWMGSEAPA